MKETTIKVKGKTTYLREFNSLSEFYDYITSTPLNDAWSSAPHGDKAQRSKHGTFDFTQTDSFDEAVTLFKDGWTSKAAKLNQMLEARKKDILTSTRARPNYSVQGFQCSVPRYLQGLPDSMINRKNVPVKQKVVTITKSVCYAAHFSKATIEAESIKALMLVYRLESQGIRCNVNIILGTERPFQREICKIRIKSANERLNVSKQAFPLVHPSMLRRLLFKYLEVAPTVTPDFVYGYGSATNNEDMRSIVNSLNNDNEFFVPTVINTDVNTITDLQNIN